MTMRTASIVAAVSTALAVCGLLTACGKQPTGPGEIPGTTVPPLSAPPPAPFEFSVSGWVRDTAWRLIPGVKVEVVDGPGLGVSAMTDANGFYQLPGVFSDTIAVGASKDGYVTSTKTHRPVRSGQSALEFFMEPSVRSVDLTGDYTLAFTADNACTQLPVEARTRTYKAAITPSQYLPPHSYDVRLSGATFYGNLVFANVAGDFARFWTDYYGDYGGGDIVELLTQSPLTSLTISFGADATVGASRVSAPVDGTFTYCADQVMNVTPGCRVPPVTCYSSNHSLTLTKR